MSFPGNAGQLRTARVTLAKPSTSGVTLNFSLADGQSWLWTVPAAATLTAPATAGRDLQRSLPATSSAARWPMA